MILKRGEKYMEFYDKYIEDLEIVFEMCRERIRCFPEPFIETGLEYIDMFNPLKVKKGNYICYLLPFWLRKPFEIDKETSRVLSMINIFKMLYFFIQDDIIDSDKPEQYSHLLPLANLFFVEFYGLYQDLMSDYPDFWTYVKRYFNDWAVSNDFEKNNSKSRDINLSAVDLSILAKKAAPIKLSACAVCSLSSKKDYIDDLDKQIDYALITLQLVDDWTDKYKDFEEGSFTHVLGEIMDFCDIEDFTNLKKADINRAAFFSDIPDKIYSIAKNHRQKISSFSIEIPDIILFHEILIKSIEDIISNINNQKKNILRGGFANFLENNSK